MLYRLMRWGFDPELVLTMAEGKQAFYLAAAMKDLEEEAKRPALRL